MNRAPGCLFESSLGADETSDQMCHLGDGSIALANRAHVTRSAVDLDPKSPACLPHIVVPRDEWTPRGGIEDLAFVSVHSKVTRQTRLQAVADQGFNFSAGCAIKLDRKAHLPTDATRVFPEGTDDSVASLHRALGE